MKEKAENLEIRLEESRQCNINISNFIKNKAADGNKKMEAVFKGAFTKLFNKNVKTIYKDLFKDLIIHTHEMRKNRKNEK